MSRPLRPLGYRPALDGVRGVAILLVVITHAAVPRFRFGDQVGVTLFFVLSGFLITSLLLEELDRSGTISLRGFYRRRVLRLAPALVVMLAVMTIANLAVGDPDAIRNSVLAIAYVGNWSVAAGSWLGNLNHTWTLAIEEQFYVLWPILLLLLVTRLRLSLPSIAAVLLASVVAVNVLRGFVLGPSATQDRIVFGSDSRADALLIGCLMAVAAVTVERLPARPVAYLGAAATAGLALLTMGMWVRIEWQLALTVLACAGFLLAALRDPLLSRVLSWRLLTYVGRISYGMYLWNVPVMWALGPVIWHFPLLPRTVLLIGANLGLAVISYQVVERPFLRMKSRRQSSGPGEQAARSESPSAPALGPSA